MKAFFWVMLVALPLANSVQATTRVTLCQESADEGPAINRFTINNYSVWGDHAAIASLALEALQIRFTIDRIPWRRCLIQTLKGHYDGAIGMGWTLTRASDFYFPMLKDNPDPSKSLLSINYPIYTLKSGPLTWDGTIISGVKHGIVAPNGFLVEKKLSKMGILLETDLGLEASFNWLLNYRVDGVVFSERIGDKMLIDEKHSEIIKLSPYFFSQPIYLVFSRASRTLDKPTMDQIWNAIPDSRERILAGIKSEPE